MSLHDAVWRPANFLQTSFELLQLACNSYSSYCVSTILLFASQFELVVVHMRHAYFLQLIGALARQLFSDTVS